MKKIYLFLVLFLFIFFLGNSQEITGTWHSISNFPDITLRIDIHIVQNDSGYSGTLDNPDGDSFGTPLDTLIISGESVKFKVWGLSYEGIYSSENQSIKGEWSYPGNSVTLNFSRQTIAPPEGSIVLVKEKYDKEELQIEMRDGINLFTSIYTPKDKSDSYPILIIRTPYNIEPQEDRYSNRMMDFPHLLKENYIIVFQDVRGRFMSEGVFEDVRPYNPNKKKKEIDENSDTYDTIDWLVKNVDNNNGNVGIFGISYPGFYSTMALPNAHPALKAASPQAPVTNWFLGDDWHHNGAFLLMDAFSFYSSIGRPRPEPTREWPSSFDFNNHDNYDFYKDIGPIKNVKRDFFGDTIQFWPELMAHPNYDDFWKARDVLPHLTDVKPAVLVVGGWFDAEDLFGPLNTYEAIEKQNKDNQNRLVMGPWFHGQWSSKTGEKLGNIHFDSNTSDYFRTLELQFFNYYLKGKGEMTLPEASIFVTGSNEWKEFTSWMNVSWRIYW